jgi:hypothetical protein
VILRFGSIGLLSGFKSNAGVNPEGLFTRDSESSSGKFRGAVATPIVVFAARLLALEPEKPALLANIA